jgi:two-component system sensor histidine kinase CpxA
MNLFFKIFLWFLAAIALMVGVIVFLNWTVQTEPVVSRWQASVRNQMIVFAATAAQIHDNEGENGLKQFLEKVNAVETVTHLDIVGKDGKFLLTDGQTTGNYQGLVANAFGSGGVELELGSPDTALAVKSFTLRNGETYAMVIRWERPRATPFFGESGLRYIRFSALLLTALALCYALARYLSSPIGKLRRATQKFAEGNLKTRVAGDIGNRRDELSALAMDFDIMAERIESLVTSQQRLSRDISHELRSPLARMNVALEIARQKSNNGDGPLLERIETESKRLNEMISQILTLSKLESGTRDFDKNPVDMKGLVEQIVSDADFEAAAKGKAVKIVRADECTTFGNQNLLRSAVENVLRNAVRYTEKGTTVEVSLESDEKNTTVKVLDHGGGVPEEELQNLFRPFYRVGEARERKTGGIGLGLAIAEQAIYAHHGTIEARNVGDGLIVEITLDCVDEPAG